jgi:V/A-type H+-transporting ATPase subunit I
MAIVKMKRFRLIALAQDRAALFSRLQRLGSVEVGEAEGKLSEPEWAALLHRDNSAAGEVKTKLNAVKHAMEALKKYAPVKSGLFLKRTELSAKDFFDDGALQNALGIADEIGTALTAITGLNTRENRLSATRASLLPWKDLPYQLNRLSTPHVKILLGVCPASVSTDAIADALENAAPLSLLYALSGDKDQHYLLFLCHEAEETAADAVLKSFAFSTTQFKDLTGTAAEEIVRIEAELDEVRRLRTEAEAKITAYGGARPALRHAMDRLAQDLSREVASEHLLTDGTIIFLEGWAADTGYDALLRELDSLPCAYSFEEPTLEETPPTLLKNPAWMEPINLVTEMYSLPQYHGGIDPNPLIFLFYIIFFGFMFADIAYGIILFTVSFLITQLYHPKKTMGYMFRLGRYLGISSAVFGALTGGFFGDAIFQFTKAFLGNGIALPSVFDPLSSPMLVLIIAISMGCVQLIVGQCIHIYMEARDGHPLEGLLDVIPWWVVFAGIGLLVLRGTAAGLIAGLVLIVLTQGRHGKGIFGKLFGGVSKVYDITAWLSDVLSYSRLMALMLAGSVIASVMNILGTLPNNVIVFFLVFIVGHVFNMGINIIGTFVHAARLQYLEFFSKFYKEGGIPFRPLQYQTKFTDITEEET